MPQLLPNTVDFRTPFSGETIAFIVLFTRIRTYTHARAHMYVRTLTIHPTETTMTMNPR